MPPLTLSTVLQIIVGLGLFNVWLVRAGSATSYRGGAATSLKEEFATYGLPPFSFYVVGALKLGSGACLLAGLWIPELVLPAAAVVVGLMLGALAMHAKVKDPLIKSLPALLMLAMSASLCWIARG